MNALIQLGCIELINSDSKDITKDSISNWTFCQTFKNPEKLNISRFSQNDFNIENNHKCFLSIKSFLKDRVTLSNDAELHFTVYSQKTDD